MAMETDARLRCRTPSRGEYGSSRVPTGGHAGRLRIMACHQMALRQLLQHGALGITAGLGIRAAMRIGAGGWQLDAWFNRVRALAHSPLGTWFHTWHRIEQARVYGCAALRNRVCGVPRSTIRP